MAFNVRTGLLIATLLLTANGAAAVPVRIAVADAVYADLAHQIGDPGVAVTLLKAESPGESAAHSFPQVTALPTGGSEFPVVIELPDW